VAIVDRTADASAAAKEIVASQLLFRGQSRYSVDQMFVNEYVLDAFHSALVREIATRLATRDLKLKPSDFKGAAMGLQKPKFPVLKISDR
jgi:acyl-CoA reductase-like NAD-dependent aldehyde dehydrogenase